jgi:hypothetical protein
MVPYTLWVTTATIRMQEDEEHGCIRRPSLDSPVSALSRTSEVVDVDGLGDLDFQQLGVPRWRSYYAIRTYLPPATPVLSSPPRSSTRDEVEEARTKKICSHAHLGLGGRGRRWEVTGHGVVGSKREVVELDRFEQVQGHGWDGQEQDDLVLQSISSQRGQWSWENWKGPYSSCGRVWKPARETVG